MPIQSSVSSSAHNSSLVTNSCIDNLGKSSNTSKKYSNPAPKTIRENNTIAKEITNARAEGEDVIQNLLKKMGTNLSSPAHVKNIFNAPATNNSIITARLFGPTTSAAQDVALASKNRAQNKDPSTEASNPALNNSAVIDSTDGKSNLDAELEAVIGALETVNEEAEVDNSLDNASMLPPPEWDKLNEIDERLIKTDDAALEAGSKTNTDASTETSGSESIGTQESSTGIQKESIGTQATAKKQASYGAENTEHSHRGSDQKALLISSLVTLAIGAIGLTVGLVEKGESSSDTDSIDQLDEMEANLGEQIETLENNAAQEQQLSETIDKFVTDCDGDAAKLTELATTLEDNKTEILDAAGAQVYETALTAAREEAFADNNNQVMYEDDKGNLVSSGVLTQAAQEECEQQATAAQQAATDKMSLALDRSISSIDEKAGDISKLSAQAAIARDDLKTLSTSDLATAESLENLIQSAELLETNMTNVISGLSQPGFVGLMATSSISLAASIPLLTKYAINRHHNSKANDAAAVKEAAPLIPDEFSKLKKAMATPTPATPENIDLAKRFAAGAV